MYLLAFVTLVISLLGIYAQVLSVEATRLANQQSAIGRAMLDYHTAAVSMAASIIRTNNSVSAIPRVTYSYQLYHSSGCSLGYQAPLAPSKIALCPAPYDATPTSPQWVNSLPLPDGSTGNFGIVYPTSTIVVCANTSSPCTTWQQENVHLPSNAALINQLFFSILYQPTGSATDFVVTFVPKATISPTNPSGLLTLPGETKLDGGALVVSQQIGLTSGDLMHQLANAARGNYLFGYVTSVVGAGKTVLHVGFASASDIAGTFQYPFPPPFDCTVAPCPLDGAIAVVSSPDGL